VFDAGKASDGLRLVQRDGVRASDWSFLQTRMDGHDCPITIGAGRARLRCRTKTGWRACSVARASRGTTTSPAGARSGGPATFRSWALRPAIEIDGCGVSDPVTMQYVLATDVGIDAARLPPATLSERPSRIGCLAEKLGLARVNPESGKIGRRSRDLGQSQPSRLLAAACSKGPTAG
jgi:hypothetical protein